MRFMLDTDTCIYIIKHKAPEVLKRFRAYSVGDIGISSVTLAELRYGVSKSQYIQRNREALDEFILPLEVADFDEKAAKAYGDIGAALEKAGTPIGSMDMLIGAHAVSLGATLITGNTREFKRIRNLKTADWSK